MSKVILLIMLAVTVTVTAQTEATTEEGKKVILNEDGTWKYSADIPAEATTEEDKSSLDCSDLIETTTDKMTGKSTTSSAEALVISKDGGKKGIGVFFMDIKGITVFSFTAVGASSCIDDENKILVLFRDGERLELINNADFNCDGKFTLYLGGSMGKKKQLKKFATEEIETIRIWTSKSYVEEDLTSEQSKQFMQTVSCLINNEK